MLLSRVNSMMPSRVKRVTSRAPWHLATGLSFARARIELQWQYSGLLASLECAHVTDMAIAADGLSRSAARMGVAMHDLVKNALVPDVQVRASRYEVHLFREVISQLFMSCLAPESSARTSVRVVDILEGSAIAVDYHLSVALIDSESVINGNDLGCDTSGGSGHGAG